MSSPGPTTRCMHSDQAQPGRFNRNRSAGAARPTPWTSRYHRSASPCSAAPRMIWGRLPGHRHESDPPFSKSAIQIGLATSSGTATITGRETLAPAPVRRARSGPNILRTHSSFLPGRTMWWGRAAGRRIGITSNRSSLITLGISTLPPRRLLSAWPLLPAAQLPSTLPCHRITRGRSSFRSTATISPAAASSPVGAAGGLVEMPEEGVTPAVSGEFALVPAGFADWTT